MKIDAFFIRNPMKQVTMKSKKIKKIHIGKN